jgi:hypothetical protein
MNTKLLEIKQALHYQEVRKLNAYNALVIDMASGANVDPIEAAKTLKIADKSIDDLGRDAEQHNRAKEVVAAKAPAREAPSIHSQIDAGIAALEAAKAELAK